MDRGAWWAAVYGVAQSLTRLKQLSSSSSMLITVLILSSEYESTFNYNGMAQKEM